MRRRSRPLRPLAALVVVILALTGPVSTALGQIGDVIEQVPVPELPTEIEDPLNEVIGTIGDQIGDIPLDNAVMLAGEDGVEAAINLSIATFPDGQSPVALLSRADLFPDSLSSGGAQGVLQAPLLVTASDALDERVAAELERLGATQVVVLGNDEAIAEAVVTELEGLGYRVDRVGGPTRVETAWQVAGATTPEATSAIVARAYPEPGGDDAQAYVDSLAVGPWAAQQRIPVLLTQTGVLTGSLRGYLEQSAITAVTVIGGEEAVGPAVVTELEAMDITVTRVAGATRYATAVAVAVARGFDTAADVQRLLLAEVDGRDDVWVPGFAAAANGGLFDGPILLTNGPVPPTETAAYVVDGLPANLSGLGGALVICTSFVNPAACEAIALLMLGQLTAVVDLLEESGLPVQDVIDTITGGDEPTEEPTDEPTGEPTPTETPTEECIVDGPLPCIPPPGS